MSRETSIRLSIWCIAFGLLMISVSVGRVYPDLMWLKTPLTYLSGWLAGAATVWEPRA